MKNVLDFFEMLVSIAMFCLALSLFFSADKSLNTRIDTIKAKQVDEDMAVDSSYETDTDALVVTKNELIALMLDDLTSNLVIQTSYGDLSIDAITFNSRLFNFSAQGFYDKYTREYHFNGSGQIDYIKFNSVGG